MSDREQGIDEEPQWDAPGWDWAPDDYSGIIPLMQGPGCFCRVRLRCGKSCGRPLVARAP